MRQFAVAITMERGTSTRLYLQQTGASNEEEALGIAIKSDTIKDLSDKGFNIALHVVILLKFV